MLAAGFSAWQGGPVDLELARTYAALDDAGRMPGRVWLWADLQADDATFSQWLAFAASRAPDAHVQLGGFKGFVDGVFSTHSAALLSPYADRPDVRGELRIEPERLASLVRRANAAGYRVALHAIGARAVRVSLDAFAAAAHDGAAQIRGLNSVEHIEHIDPADVPRFAALGVAASMQPTHFAFGHATDSYYATRLGPARLAHTFPWRELLDARATLAFGTDYPVVDADPIAGVYAAVHRTHDDGTEFVPAQRIDAPAALEAYSVTPAEVAGVGDELGRIAVGMRADLVVLRDDPSTARTADVAWLMIDGRVVEDACHRP
jgi:hypothetical protein